MADTTHDHVYFLFGNPGVLKALSGKAAPREDMVDVELMALKIEKRRKQR